jgi:hypothetical protein
MSFYGYNKIKSVRVVKLFMQDSGTYNQQFARPYNTFMEAGTLNAITEHVVRYNKNPLEKPNISGMVGDFIQPQATPERLLSITNGWAEKRIRFTLQLEIVDNLGTVCSQYILGYTSFNGVTHSGNIAPDMVFFVNSSIKTKRDYIQTAFGTDYVESVVSNDQVLASNTYTGLMSANHEYLLRPEDTFGMMQTSHLPSSFGGDGTIYDSRTMLRTEATLSRRANNLPGSYVSNILGGYMANTALADFGQNEIKILEKSRGNVVEGIAVDDPFLGAIAKVTNSTTGNQFMFKDLLALDPNATLNTTYNVLGKVELANTHQAGQTCHWSGSDRTTQVATILSQAIPAIMMELALVHIAFSTSNMNYGSQITTIISNARGFTKCDVTKNCDMFRYRLENEILKDLTFNNTTSIGLEMVVSMAGETWIKLQVDSNPIVDFVVPSFCDNLLAPILTTNQNLSKNIANDFEMLNTNIAEALHGRMTYPSVGNSFYPT